MAQRDQDEWKKKQKELAKKLRREAYLKQKAYAKEMQEKAATAAAGDSTSEDAEVLAQKERAKEYARAQRKAAYQKAKEVKKAEQATVKAEARQEKQRVKEERDHNNPLLQQLRQLKATKAEEQKELEHDNHREQLLAEAMRKTLN